MSPAQRFIRLAPLLSLALLAAVPAEAQARQAASTASQAVMHRTVKVDGLDIFYREAGPRTAPTILLLHGFPTSSHMFRNLIPALMDRYHVVAPDFPGYGHSSMPDRARFSYTFANLADVTEKFTRAIGLESYTLYVMDYGAPVGYRMAIRHPDRVQALIVQNGNAYDEGLREFWNPFKRYWNAPTQANRDSLRTLLTMDATRWQYLNGVRDSARISPDNWIVDQRQLDRAGNDEVQLDLFYDYRTNVPLYPQFQAYFRERQPPTLIVWGKNDFIFPAEGAAPYRRDLRTVEYHILDTGHFALEDQGAEIAAHIRAFMGRHVPSRATRVPTRTSRGSEAGPRGGHGVVSCSSVIDYTRWAISGHHRNADPSAYSHFAVDEDLRFRGFAAVGSGAPGPAGGRAR